MRFPGLNRRRSRTFMLAIGQLVLVAYVFQIAAVDHWNVDPGRDVHGVVDSSVHVAHCHGDAASCADSAGGFATISPQASNRLPLPPELLARKTTETPAAPQIAAVLVPTEPPRAA